MTFLSNLSLLLLPAYHPLVLRGLLATILILTPSLARAWTPAAEKRMAFSASRLAPPDVRLLIEKYSQEFTRGLALAAADEGNDGHRYSVSSRKGRLQARLKQETEAAAAMVRQGQSMRGFVERLGVIAHFVSDANNPFHLDDSDPRLSGCQADYEAYFEKQISKFPLVFYGLDSALKLDPYIERVFSRTATFYPLIGEEFFRFGERRSTDEFDDRSTAFGVASIAYSRGVTDIVNLYYYIWRRAGGDVRSASRLRRGTVLPHAN